MYNVITLELIPEVNYVSEEHFCFLSFMVHEYKRKLYWIVLRIIYYHTLDQNEIAKH